MEPPATAVTRKRRQGSSAADGVDDKAATITPNGEKRQKRRGGEAIDDFRKVIGTLIRTLHLNILTVSAQSTIRPFNDNRRLPSTTLLPIDDTLQRIREIALSDAIPWKTFWGDVYVGMCATMHFFNVPVPGEMPGETQYQYLFCPTRLESITDRFATEYNLSATTRQHLSRIYAAFYPSFESESSIVNGVARDHNDKVYEKMWLQMSNVASTYIDIVCQALELHAKRTSGRVEYNELCEYLRLTYETAMLNGHVLLAAPLSQFAPLRIVQTLNDMLMHRIHLAYKQYGLCFQSIIVPTSIAVIQFTTLLRGLRPAQLWPFENERLWPKFIADQAAVVSYYFVTGLQNSALLRSNDGERDRRRRMNYVNEYKVKSNCLMTLDIHERADSEELRHLEKYLNLVHERKTCDGAPASINVQMWNLYHDDENLHLLNRKICGLRQCYSCNYDFCLMSMIKTCRRGQEGMLDDDEEETAHAVPVRRVVATPSPSLPEQCDIVSSTTTTNNDSIMERQRQRKEQCVLANIVKNTDDQYALEDKFALTNGDFCNLLTLNAPSIHHDALLSYQAFGLRKFPCEYDLGVHLDISRYLFATHTTRFVKQRCRLLDC